MSAIPPHTLYIYGKPRINNGLMDSFAVSNYKHKLTWQGGYDTASCNPAVNQAKAEQIFRDYLGNAVAAFVDDATMPIFDGFINAINYEIGAYTFRRSLDEMANRVQVTFYNADSPAAQKTEITAIVNNTVSQSIYGIKETNLDAGVHYNNADKSHKTVLRDTILNNLAFPQVSVASRTSGGVLISLEIKGWYHLWDWVTREDSANLTYNAGDAFHDKAAGGAQSANTVYIAQTFPTAGYARLLTANTSFNISQNSQTGQTYLQFLQQVVEAGDGVNEWVYGITPRLAGTGGTQRLIYYRPANTQIEYRTRAVANAGIIYDITGNRIDPWRVKPDNGIAITDVLANFSAVRGDDPRESYLKFIEYDAEAQSVSWQSSDDNTLEGALNLRKYFKRHGKRFGAPVRQLV